MCYSVSYLTQKSIKYAKHYGEENAQIEKLEKQLELYRQTTDQVYQALAPAKQCRCVSTMMYFFCKISLEITEVSPSEVTVRAPVFFTKVLLFIVLEYNSMCP